ncbi:uncharacterized protein CTHT_0066550 [Thermochaetoides thermophila DSM 1495]|uniref:Uncharacterized protein n=1 Tax=Chaetomium thermophilum (strain DSM 1495 / CBS 144.50 / IMI 039719) TaxID=759272 RepID=G0SGJ5_CHATD|nr:hypothetical protein CTHT_0066550 [Thermochaetoides thermophila DSM 1495]EGS17334.1 hypothetical protein CTHT_0066550 [Thermochaetoides thermophila DSM 1495]
MAPPIPPRVLPRDSESGGKSLSSGAIVGIAIVAGALSVGAIALFYWHWRRQRRFDLEDASTRDSFDEPMSPSAIPPNVAYTLDYKMDQQNYGGGDQESSCTYSPEKSIYTISPLGAPPVPSAMPTHPAYIPRALVRGSTSPSHRSSSTTAVASSPPIPSHSLKIRPDDPFVPAYLKVAQEQTDQSQITSSSTSATPQSLIEEQLQRQTQSPDSGSYSSGLPLHPSQRQSGTPSPESKEQHHPRKKVPPRLILSSSTFTAANAPKTVIEVSVPGVGNTMSSTTASTPASPNDATAAFITAAALSRSSTGLALQPLLPFPVLLIDKPLLGKENTTISGPLAFPQHYIPPPRSPPSTGFSQTFFSNKKSKAKKSKRRCRSRSGWKGKRDSVATLDGATDADEEDEVDDEEQESSRHHHRMAFKSRLEHQSAHEKGKDRDRKEKKRNSGNRYYAEVEIGNGNDIW